MNDEIWILANEFFLPSNSLTRNQIEAFYRAAFNAGIEAAAHVCGNNISKMYGAGDCMRDIRRLEMK